MPGLNSSPQASILTHRDVGMPMIGSHTLEPILFDWLQSFVGGRLFSQLESRDIDRSRDNSLTIEQRSI